VAQKIIDPGNLGTLVKEVSVDILPDSARKFGHVPDFSQCKAGDLILFRRPSPDFFARKISWIQARGGFAPEDNCWTHAAVFLEEDFVVEAVPGPGVQTRSLYSDIPHRILRVRRRIQLSEIDRYRIALRALRMFGARYSSGAALSLGWEMYAGLWNRIGFSKFGTVVICSKVFYDAYTEITRSLLKGCPIDTPVTPAHLSATSDLEDVDVGWLKLT